MGANSGATVKETAGLEGLHGHPSCGAAFDATLCAAAVPLQAAFQAAFQAATAALHSASGVHEHHATTRPYDIVLRNTTCSQYAIMLWP